MWTGLYVLHAVICDLMIVQMTIVIECQRQLGLLSLFAMILLASNCDFNFQRDLSHIGYIIFTADLKERFNLTFCGDLYSV